MKKVLIIVVVAGLAALIFIASGQSVRLNKFAFTQENDSETALRNTALALAVSPKNAVNPCVAIVGREDCLESAPPIELSGAWRTFAKPLALSTDNLLLFERFRENTARIWQIEWKTRKIYLLPVPELHFNGKARFTAISSPEGLWLLGDTSLLIRPDGQRLSLATKFDEPVAVLLNDHSILALGESLNGKNGDLHRVQQLRLHSDGKQLQMIDRGLLSYDGTPDQAGKAYRTPRFGHSAVTLRDGRVLLLGGDVTTTLASLIEPGQEEGAWGVKPVANMPNEHTQAATTLLPDGRVAVTGSPRCYAEAGKARSVDVYDVPTNRWSSLPPLPFVPCSDAYGADKPAMTTTPNGSLVVGGHLEPQVMVLPRDSQSSTGYANSWNVYGQMQLRRISGVMQALSDQEVVVAGGVDSIGGCCSAITGYDRINIATTESKQSLALSFIGAGVAKRGQNIFVSSGRRFGRTSTGQMRYSAYAELIDLATGSVRQLPNVPFASGAAKAFWLDDDRVLLKGIKEANGRGFALNDNTSSYMPPSSGDMAIFNLKESRWSAPYAMPELDAAQIISADGNTALLLDDSGQVRRLNLVSRELTTVQQAQRGRHGGIARLLPSDKLVLSGGEVQNETVSVLDADCEATASKDCPEKFVGFGPYAANALVEVLPLRDGDDSTVSTLSNTGPTNVVSTVITSEGQTLVLTDESQSKNITISRSNAIDWVNLPLPKDIEMNRDGYCGSCALQVAPDPRNPGKDLIFFRQGAVAVDYIDDQIEDQILHVWCWNEAEQNWQHVLTSRGMSTRSSPLALEYPLSPKEGKRMMSMGWHLHEPLLWIEQQINSATENRSASAPQ